MRPGEDVDPGGAAGTRAEPAGARGGWRPVLWRRLSLVHDTALPLALALLISVPLLPGSVFGQLPSKLALGMKTISLVHNWNMYAPDPQRAHTYLAVHAEFADGRRVALAEAEQAASAWTRIWGWQKTRVDVWRFYAAMNADKPNVNRTWYLRSVCVREALARGEAPTQIVAERVRRRFTSPDRVRAGQPGLGPLDRKHVGAVDCRTFPVRDMIAAASSRGTGE